MEDSIIFFFQPAWSRLPWPCPAVYRVADPKDAEVRSLFLQITQLPRIERFFASGALINCSSWCQRRALSPSKRRCNTFTRTELISKICHSRSQVRRCKDIHHPLSPLGTITFTPHIWIWKKGIGVQQTGPAWGYRTHVLRTLSASLLIPACFRCRSCVTYSTFSPYSCYEAGPLHKRRKADWSPFGWI